MTDPSVGHLLGRLGVMHARVKRLVDRRRAEDPDAEDRFRGLYIPDGEVGRLLADRERRPIAAGLDAAEASRLDAVESAADAAVDAGADLRLRRLAVSFALDPDDVEILVVALAPDLDPRFERLYAYLHDDVSRRRASIGLALELCGLPAWSAGRARLGPASPLVAGGLLGVEEPDRPFLTRSLRVPDRVAAHLLGDDTPDVAVGALTLSASGAWVGDVATLVRALGSLNPLVYVHEEPGSAGLCLAAGALAKAGLDAVCIDVGRIGVHDDLPEVLGRAEREARLRSCGLVAYRIEALASRGPDGVRRLASCRCPAVLVGSVPWDPDWSDRVVLVVDAPPMTDAQQAAVWRSSVNGSGPPAFDAHVVTGQFRLSPEQLVRATEAASLRAAAEDRPMEVDDLRAGARGQNAAGLGRLAHRLEPEAGWRDLVLPAVVLGQLRELPARVRGRGRVLGEWGMGGRSSRGRGVKALFAGDSGTGKTLSAEVIAGELGLDLYVIDLSTVVDKYVGETEKNLDRIFVEADRVNGVLLFDEADALFGKRSEVRDAHDRYANVEVAYLLQRMERFEGLALLTTNMRSNLDEAFARRLDAIVDFPMPEEDDRRRLWILHLPLSVPRADDVDVGFLARAFKISGGNIRNICLTAAYLAAERGGSVTMADLVRGTEREYRKLGHLCVESEFGPWFSVVGGGQTRP